jgi:hypothetical protein
MIAFIDIGKASEVAAGLRPAALRWMIISATV